ncbi:MAG: ankyrin repeat domain-containing protein [Armatimonadota bacterium]|nr:ankyrin repeat domain-containing protein [Armatimonadota bacterium]
MRNRWLWLLGAALILAVGALALRGSHTERPRFLTVHEAVRAGDFADVQYHISHGTSLRELDSAGYSGLHVAAIYGRPRAAELLLSKGLDPDIRDRELTIRCYTALHLAARENSDEVARALLEAGADPNARDSGGMTPLHLAAMNDSAQAAEILLAYDANVNARDDEYQTPLGVALEWQKPNVGRVLVQHGGVK